MVFNAMDRPRLNRPQGNRILSLLIIALLLTGSSRIESQQSASFADSSARHSAREKQAVLAFWNTYTSLFSAPVNSADGAKDIANKLEAVLRQDLDQRYREFALEVIQVLRVLAANAKPSKAMEQLVNGGIAYGVGRVPTVDLGENARKTSAFDKTFASIHTSALKLRLIAETEFGIDLNQSLSYTWSSEKGIVKDDYEITNRNATAWEDVTIKIAYQSGVSKSWQQSKNFSFSEVAAGQTLRFKDLFISSETIDGAQVCIVITTKKSVSVKMWRCVSKTGPWGGLLAGFECYWEYRVKEYFDNLQFLTLGGTRERVIP
jgi:hypothetical protein